MSAALLTVPRYGGGEHRRTALAARATVERITPAVRQRAARRLHDALTRRTFAPAALECALVAGDAGLAALMREHAALPPLASATKQDFCRLAPAPVPVQARQQLVAWIEHAMAMGMLAPDALRSLAAGGFDAADVRALLVGSFNAYAQGIADAVPRCAWADTRSVIPILVQPAVLALLDGDELPSDSRSELVPALGLHLSIVDGPVFAMPTQMARDEAFYRAYTSAWDDLANATQTGLMLRCADTWPIFIGYYDEQLADLALQATFTDGQWHFDDACCDMVEDEIGFNLRDEDMRAMMSTHLSYRRQRAALKPMAAGSAEYRRWIARAPAPQRALVEYLRQLAAHLHAQRKGNRKDWQHHSDSGVVGVALMDTDHGLDDFVNDNLNMIGAEEQLCEVVQAGAAAQLPALVSTVLLEVAIIHAAANALYDFKDRYC